ncbi:hypothetical protein NEFER03_1337 [Nematocida sp. LUAm3]|nr:hypothetical protein NEFER03_1337 [Nematocida sp. LUAm3]KAI5174041.1 hypothetical protein NEFER02_0508 [Nematocida sp. LUAm2]KAI5177216.1 hypothetical protein NEFER01_0491 [Nematocida sp. LUAm1]
MNIKKMLLCAMAYPLVASRIYDTCQVAPTEGFAIIKYYREDCIHCKNISPKIQQIIDSIEKHGTPITGMMVNVDKCKEESKHIEALPTISIQKDGKEITKFSGDLSYKEIVQKVSFAMELPFEIFHEIAVPEKKSLIRLTKNDFLSGFSGPWVIYFEDSYSDVLENMLLQTYRAFDGDIKIAKYVGADKEIIAGRYYIYDFPGILIMNDGILMRYNGELSLGAFHEFCSRLVEPSFREISPEELEKISSPAFVVFYSDIVLANRTFRRIAHDLKMNAITYKMKMDSPGEDPLLRLAVFKNGSKFYFEGDINDEGGIREWLFHAHFPNISKLSMDNFYSIFHGLKPAIAIVTDSGNNKEISIFEEVAMQHNKGSSSSPYIFVFIDKKEYPKFTETNFGALHNRPLVVFFDPEKQLFFGKRVRKNESFSEYLQEQIKGYTKGELPQYIKQKPNSYLWLLLVICGISGVSIAAKLLHSTRKKVLLE